LGAGCGCAHHGRPTTRRGSARAARRGRSAVRPRRDARAHAGHRERRSGGVIRPGSRERSFRVALVVTGDFLAAWGALAAVVAIRRAVPLPLTRRLLAPQSFALDAENILLFGGALVAALALSGFYRQRVMARAR